MRIPVDRCGRTEYDVFHSLFFHDFGEHECTCNVVQVVTERLGHGLADSFQRREMDDGIESGPRDNRGESWFVEDVDLAKIHCLAGQFLHTTE